MNFDLRKNTIDRDLMDTLYIEVHFILQDFSAALSTECDKRNKFNVDPFLHRYLNRYAKENPRRVYSNAVLSYVVCNYLIWFESRPEHWRGFPQSLKQAAGLYPEAHQCCLLLI
jgi:hypothetical protein